MSIPAVQPATPATRALMDGWLTEKVGTQRVDNVLERQVRFRFADGGIVPDNARSAALLQSPAGPRLERALMRGFSAATDAGRGASNIEGVVLPRDIEGAAIGNLLGMRRDGNLPAGGEIPPEIRGRMLGALRREVKTLDQVNGGFNQAGWVTLMPDQARSLLAGVGAYHPDAGELASNKGYTSFLPHLLRHESEHSVTPGGFNVDNAWIEEGIAEALTNARGPAAAARHDLPPARYQHGRVAAASGRATADWRPWSPKVSDALRDVGNDSDAEYAAREGRIGDLLKLAGIDRHTRSGYQQAREVLQGGSLERTPGRLAEAIAEHHDLSPHGRRTLREGIRDLDRAPGDAVAALAHRVGIDG